MTEALPKTKGYLIGDVHGNAAELKNLLARLELRTDKILIFLGDYIGKKQYTKKTLELLKLLENKYNCVFIKGNHEFVWDRYLNYNEVFRKEFLLNHGSIEALKQYVQNPRDLVVKDDIRNIKDILRPYLNFIEHTQDYYFVSGYLAMHAGLMEEQLSQDPLRFSEENYFLRKEKMNLNKLYLNKYIIIAGHTYLGKEPFIQKGYINIDLGAGYNGYLGAFDLENRRIIRSDGKTFLYD